MYCVTFSTAVERIQSYMKKIVKNAVLLVRMVGLKWFKLLKKKLFQKWLFLKKTFRKANDTSSVDSAGN
jgi:ABC-type uncharacterized transport system fused permease/ATPase subunit